MEAGGKEKREEGRGEGENQLWRKDDQWESGHLDVVIGDNQEMAWR